MRRASMLLRRTVRSVELIAKDQRIPKPLRWLLAVSLLPIPGPFDEAVLLSVAPLLFTLYRQPMREAWRRAREPRAADPYSPTTPSIGSARRPRVEKRPLRAEHPADQPVIGE